MFPRYLLLALVWCSTLSFSLASIEPADPKRYPHSAEVGQNGLVVFEITERGDRPEHLCMVTDYNCTTPHGLCSDDHDKYQLIVVENPVNVGGVYKWFCGIEINSVRVNDVGKYEVWGHHGNWNPGRHINFAVWERDTHGRICQTSLDENSNELVYNCTSLTTHPPSTTERLTTEGKETTTFTSTQEALEPYLLITSHGPGSNDALNDGKREGDGVCHSTRDIILTAVCMFIVGFILVAVIWAIRRGRKKWRRDRFGDFEDYRSGVKMESRPYANNGDAVHHENEVDGEPPA